MVSFRKRPGCRCCRGMGPQERAFKHMVHGVLRAMHMAEADRDLPGSRQKPRKPLVPEQHPWYPAGRLTPAEYQHLRQYSDAEWRINELPPGPRREWWEHERDRRFAKIPAYLRKFLPQPLKGRA